MITLALQRSILPRVYRNQNKVVSRALHSSLLIYINALDTIYDLSRDLYLTFKMDIAANIQHILTASKDLVLHKLGARERLVTLARSLIATLETPSERIFRLAFAEPANFALVRTAVDLQVFETLKNAGSTPVTVSALAKPANADPVFVHRLMRHLAAMDIVHEASANEFTSTGFTNALTEDRFRGGIIYTYDVLGPSLRRLPEYMKDTTYRNPSDPAGGPFQFAHDTKDPFFPWLMGHEKYMTSFNQYMGGYRVGKPTWLDPGLYPIDSTLTLDTQGEAEKGVLIVDVGGGMGQDLQELKTKQPGVRGRMVLQDLPAVIDQIKDLDAGIERTPHDFFTTQPVAGVYRSCFCMASLADRVLQEPESITCTASFMTGMTDLVSRFSRISSLPCALATRKFSSTTL